MKTCPPAISKMAIVHNLPTLSQKKKVPSFIKFQPQLCSLFSLQKKVEDKNKHTECFQKKWPAISCPSFVQLPCHTNIVDPGALHRAFFSLPQHPIRRSHRHYPPGPVRSWNRWAGHQLMEFMDTWWLYLCFIPWFKRVFIHPRWKEAGFLPSTEWIVE